MQTVLSGVLATCLVVFSTSSSASPLLPKAAHKSLMRPVTINQMTLKTMEYWVFEGQIPFRYPDDVIRGFYPESIPEQTIRCAEIGYNQILSYLKSSPIELEEALALGVTRLLVVSVNDYSLASPDRAPRAPKLSHWGLDRDLTQGFWRWEITLTRNEDCMTPRLASIRETFRSISRRSKAAPPRPAPPALW